MEEVATTDLHRPAKQATVQTEVRLLLFGVLLVTGAALAAPVPVITMEGGSTELLGRLEDGAPLSYSYRQSIYDVPVREEFIRLSGALVLLRVRSPDIRSIEYFRWDGNIVQDADGQFAEDAPSSEHPELVIRVTTLGEQRITTPGWTVSLREQFGESIVTVRVGHRPRALVLLRGVG